MARGSLRIHLGAAPGVGTTYAMLAEGSRRARRGARVVVAVVDARGRPATAAQLGDLEVVPPVMAGEGVTAVATIDVAAVVARRPDVALVDDLATDPGLGAPPRWQQVDELLDAGIDVVGTLHIGDLDSLRDTVERITGAPAAATVPDRWVRRAEQVELVDMTPEALRRRLAHGNVYPAEQVDAALANAFRPANLGALRELALLWVADRVEDQLQGQLGPDGAERAWETRERVVVALTGAPGGDVVLRRAARMAGRLGGDLVGVHVARAEGPAPDDDGALAEHRRLLEALGGTAREVVADDVAEALVAVARAERATQIVVGASRRSPWQEATGGSIVNRLLRLARDLDVHIISGHDDGTRRRSAPVPAPRPRRSALARERRRSAWILLAVGLPLVTLALVPFRAELGVPTPLLVMISLVLAVAALGGLVPGLVAAVAGAALVNLFFVEPYGTLHVAEAHHVMALVVFVAVGATVATLVDRVARHAAESARARRRTEALARAARTLATSAEPLPVLLDELVELVGVRAASVLRRTESGWQVLATAGEPVAASPDDGETTLLRADGRDVLVVDAPALPADDAAIVDALAQEVGVALGAVELQREVAAGQALAEAEALRVGILQAVSHDLRTPLAGIKASVTSLLAPDVSFDEGDTSAFLHAIDHEVDRLDRVVGNLLDMSRLQSGSLRVVARPTALEEVVAASLTDFDDDELARLDVRVSEELPLVVVDGSLLERALANVVANALAASPVGGPPVVVEAAAVGGRVHLRVVDRGPGIPAEHRDAVFEPFQRLGDRSSRAGVGLGLAIARGFTRAMAGELDLEDTPGGGLTTVFALPAEAAPAAARRPEVVV